MDKNTVYEDSLKRSGLKNTKQRCAILSILENSDQPIAAEEIFLELKSREIPVNLSTVYRTLEIMSEKELITKLNIVGDNRALFEYNRRIHKHYLVCIKCKKILAINDCPLESYEQELAEQTHYAIAGHRLDVYGYCPDCQLCGQE